MNRHEKAKLLEFAARLVRAVCAPTPDVIAEPVRAVAMELRDFADDPEFEALGLLREFAEKYPAEDNLLRRTRQFLTKRRANS